MAVSDFLTDHWSNSSTTPTDRLNALKDLEESMAREQRRKARPIEVDNSLGNGRHAEYNDEKSIILIKEDFITDPTQNYEAMEAVIHEGRHAYQNDIAKGRIFSEETIETTELWKNNTDIDVYIKSYEGQYIYRFQPIETDAHDYAYAKMEYLEPQLNQDENYNNYMSSFRAERKNETDRAIELYGKDYKQKIADTIEERYELKQRFNQEEEIRLTDLEIDANKINNLDKELNALKEKRSVTKNKKDGKMLDLEISNLEKSKKYAESQLDKKRKQYDRISQKDYQDMQKVLATMKTPTQREETRQLSQIRTIENPVHQRGRRI